MLKWHFNFVPILDYPVKATMLCYTFSPRSFENIMHQLYNEEEIFFSSRTRRSRTFICLVLLSVAVVVFLITSVVFVTLYCLEQGTHSKPMEIINSMNASATNHNIQCAQESQNTPCTAGPTTSKSTAGPFTSLSTAKLRTSLSAARLTTTLMSTTGPQISLSTAAQNISQSTPEPKSSLRLQRPKTPDTPKSLKLKYCGSKACQFASIGRKKHIFKSEIIAHINQAGEGYSPGGGVLPCIRYIGMCRPKGYGF